MYFDHTDKGSAKFYCVMKKHLNEVADVNSALL